MFECCMENESKGPDILELGIDGRDALLLDTYSSMDVFWFYLVHARSRSS